MTIQDEIDIQARKTFSLDDLATSTAGVECPKDIGVLDEIPYSYKDINDVMSSQRDLVDIVHTLRQVVNVKGGGSEDK
jgi:tRNA-splicing ligase RtcB